MSSRMFLYEDFDQARHSLLGCPPDRPACAGVERDAPPSSEFEIARRESFEAGRAHGFAQGRQAALEEAEVRLAGDLPELLANLGGAAAKIDEVKRACERDALLLAGAALRQLLPLIAERGLGHETAALVADVAANIPVPTIEVCASARTRAAIERRCEGVPSGVALVTDPDLPDGSVRCAWAHGEARFDGAALQEAILAILDRHLERLDQADEESRPEQGLPSQED